MRKSEKERIKRVKISQKAAKTLKVAERYVNTLAGNHLVPSPELGLVIVRHLTVRQLQHVLLQPVRFDRAFPKCDIARLATEELIDRKLKLEQEETE